MTNSTLAQSYLVKARSRLKILDVLLDDDNYDRHFDEQGFSLPETPFPE